MSTTLEFVCKRDDLAPGEMRPFTVGRTRIVLCRTDDRFAALRDICSHQGAALSGGLLTGTNVPCPVVGHYEYGRAGEIVRCPRHGYEFDIWTGKSLHNPDHERVKAYPVVERDGDVFIELEAR